MYAFIPYTSSVCVDPFIASTDYKSRIEQRRTVRDFSDKPVDQKVIENIIMTASSAPSGANKQPWTFCAIADPNLKKQIRIAAEKEEHDNYHHRMGEAWLKDLAPLGTDEHKEFLEMAPWLIIVFKHSYQLVDGVKHKTYYANESVGIACGFLLTAIFEAGLVALTHTPSPMNFLKSILKRPEYETPYLLIPVGYASEKATVPDIKRKEESEVIVWY